MGYGGALIWSALARNLKIKYPHKKIVFIYKKSIKSFIFLKSDNDHQVYINNGDIFLVVNKISWWFQKWRFRNLDILEVDLNDPIHSHIEKDSREKVYYKTGRHAIQIACDAYGIGTPILQPYIKLTADEKQRAEKILRKIGLLGKLFICIEPHSKPSFTPNKAWPWENWQTLVDQINKILAKQKKDVKILQIGAHEGRVLNGVISANGMTSFRESGAILESALFFIGTMGGLVHLSKGMGKRNIVLISAFEPKELASYPDDINFYTKIFCGNCGLKIPCPIEIECMKRVSIRGVVDSAVRLIEECL